VTPTTLPWRSSLLRHYGLMPDHPMKLRLYNWLIATRLFRHTIAKFPYGTFNLDLIDFVQHAMFQDGCYEPRSFAVFRSLIKTGARVIDVGANVGQYALAAANLAGSSGQIVAVEPNPVICAKLIENARLSQVERRVSIVTFPLSDGPHLIDFGLPDPRALGTTRPRVANELGGFTARAATIGELAMHFGLEAIDVLKVDVEGYDLAIINSMFVDSSIRPEHILFEYLPEYFAYGISDRNLNEYFADFGYRLVTIDDEPYSPGLALPEGNLWAQQVPA
jgi:FkbM family methyltransferase